MELKEFLRITQRNLENIWIKEEVERIISCIPLFRLVRITLLKYNVHKYI